MKTSKESKKEEKDYKRKLDPYIKRIKVTPRNFKEFIKSEEEE